MNAQSTPAGVCGETIFALTSTNSLIKFSSDQPGTIISSVGITGLQSGENLIGIDFRPRDRQLYGVSNQNRIYIINTSTGIAASNVTLSTPVSGAAFGFDFNPQADRLRITSEADQNLRIDVTNGNTTSDMLLQYAAGDANSGSPKITGSAYTNNFDLTPATALFGIDSDRDILVRQNPPNNGTLNTIGSLGVNTSDAVGFDISPSSTRAFAALTPPGIISSNLYTINLTTGAATLIGTIGGSQTVMGLAIPFDRPQTVFAVTSTNRLISFDSLTPGVIAGIVQINGLRKSENIVGIDFRPATGVLYALSNFGVTYTINTNNGRATRLGLLSSNSVGAGSFGFDFNPQVDRIRIVNDFDHNLRLVPTDGSLAATDTSLAYSTTSLPADPNAGQNPNIVGSAYTNNFNGTTLTLLYGIDSNLDILATQNPPNNGILNTVGSLINEATSMPLDVTNQLGFDIYRCDPVGLVAVNIQGDTVSRLFRVNLATGAVVQVGAIGGGEFVRALAIR
jgi:hypothetical protein